MEKGFLGGVFEAATMENPLESFISHVSNIGNTAPAKTFG